ncbi:MULTISPECIES: acyl-CoA thioesterase [Rufibacter]|uniref:Acyl-CoA thioester hydrolase n=1 Tax=Rufibacter quisquiliarum TaxID=1549639 RepID=A0A839G8D4_9BACT|nr:MULTISPECIES: acyl-CoA thioesterase [Rufibacter]MBA9075704.1 acyl-CoA thioester hydrolase [Rufibacter quisquiliarum]
MKEQTTSPKPAVLESQTRIRFDHCDPFGHLNNSAFLNYFQNEREDQVEAAYGLDIHAFFRKTGRAWVVGQNQIVYLNPAQVRELVTIQTSIRHVTETSMLVEHLMFDAEKKRLKSVLWTKFIYIDVRKNERASHEPELMELFNEVAVKEETPALFEDRVKQLREQMKASAQPKAG